MSTSDPLRKWLNSNEKSQRWLARQAGTYPQRVCDFLAGRRRLSPDVADRIEQITKGAVTMRQLLGLPRRAAGGGR